MVKKGKESPYFINRTGEVYFTKQGYEIDPKVYQAMYNYQVEITD